MAEIDVQVKKKSSILPWLLLALGVIALVVFLMRRNNDGKNDVAEATTTINNTTDNAANAVKDGWNSIDWNAPEAKYDEIKGADIAVRGADNYAIYGLGEDVLFDKGSATVRSSAVDNLRQVAASIKQRYDGGEVRVFGFTDATGSAGQNQELSQQRAEAVKSWLAKEGGITADKISLHPQGENNPVASNNTEAGKQQNRRVEIVARKAS